ncbi:Gfo/Idh/MocA family oxidoreductase [Synechococcus sp. CS-602]|uniref:Gfo/Idh/MocA family protein n=1 Tax=Synechococcaceae TaxID=1890426 RepID=UPI0008FF5195|nr:MULTISPECIES: Gfo/Idh/MocA family oxidoreductase [Synechococcaceae]MCT4365107.1 Gfo/Idh/MocA family oxidoreductase [Candidatus Regnicoccus frigidus MAG-AL1]APD47270.1 oxidoreductase [Synechococcus sp. SynAce01]MCT0202080.1 Gfo/Idh/MocA family oxidoreductase [Synechococcus sp. CS-603]MCT0205740.1 Gfo/Idh/MocA family oxidoreductase [Synechococcus sp. CS-602]MCT0244858.1 Gfo/Idh/MocA family oxidoreductase [Synechococcus sp. CS-601]
MTTTASPLKVAVAGLGFGEKVHLPALRACPGTEPVALWHPRTARLEAACRSAELPGFSDFEALLADPGIEAVVIATPPAPRFELACAALKAGKHLLLEKPVCLEAEQVLELQRLAISAGLSVAVDFEYRAVPLFQQLEALLRAGAIGDPWLVTMDWLMGSRADASRPWSWYSQRSEGGGVLGALGTHAFDILQWLVGPCTALSASLATAIPERPLPDGSGRQGRVDADDSALLGLELEGERGQRIPAQLALSSVTRQGRGCWLELHGSEGALVLGSDNRSDYVHGFQLWQASGSGPLQLLAPDPNLAFAQTWVDGRIAPVARLHQAWSDSVREGRPMLPGLAEGYRSQRCCDRALLAAETGERQNIT